MAIYKGFSTYKFEDNKQFSESDIELVKTDIVSHIFTSLGSRVMMPEFGTIIPDILFEPLDDITTLAIEDELRKVFTYDPRVELLNLFLDVDAERSAVTASADLFYLELNKEDRMDLNLQFED